MISQQCDREKIRQLLADTLPASVEKEVSEHLAICSDCQSELETLAAEGSWWNEAYLRLNRGIQSDFRASGESHSDDDCHFATDFAVDFLEPSDDPQMLGRLGDYEIVAIIGRGGMGIVVKGFQKELHRHVAVKVLSPHLATSAAARRRFAREAQATAAVVHPHVMAIHSVQANAKLPYLVMPFVECESLQQRLDQHGPLDLKDILRIGMQTALGLAAAHAQGLVHRDVKPANILVEKNVDRVVLTDFGLARAVDDATFTRTGIIAGTPQYMSPEQANGDSIDPRSDLFSLGAVLYSMSTGRPPFRAETTFGILRRIRETTPRSIREINSDIPLWFERIVLKLLEKHPDDRFPSAQAVATLLEQCLAYVQNPTVVNLPAAALNLQLRDDARRDDVVSTKASGRWQKRLKQFAWFGLVAAVIGLTGTTVVQYRLAHQAKDPVQRESAVIRVEDDAPVSHEAATASQSEPAVSPDETWLRWNGVDDEIDALEQAIKEVENQDANRDPASR